MFVALVVPAPLCLMLFNVHLVIGPGFVGTQFIRFCVLGHELNDCRNWVLDMCLH